MARTKPMTAAAKAKMAASAVKRWKAAKSLIAKGAWARRKEKGVAKCKEILNQPIVVANLNVDMLLEEVRKMSKDEIMKEYGSVPLKSMSSMEPDYRAVIESETLEAYGWPDRFDAIEATDAPRDIKIEAFDKLIENYRAAVYKTYPKLHPDYKEEVKPWCPFDL